MPGAHEGAAEEAARSTSAVLRAPMLICAEKTRKRYRARLFRAAALAFALALTAAGNLFASAPSFAQTNAAEFYRGKTLNIVVGYGPGGGYDLYARLLARHMGPRIPGQPAISVQNMPGAASLRATNFIATSAPKDGTHIAAFDRNMPLIAILGGNSNVQFDPLKLTWLGTLSDSSEDAFVVWSRQGNGVNAVQDLRGPAGPTLTVGVTGIGATDNDIAVLFRDVLKLRIKVVPGYQDSNKIGLAVENGEVDGQFIGFLTAKATKPTWFGEKTNMRVLAQFARKTRHPDLPDVPMASELAPDEEARQLIAMAELPYLVGRPFAGPPDMPADRARALQSAFIETARDKAFVDEARRLKIDVTPLNAEDTLAAVRALADTPVALKERLRTVLYSNQK
jgi:tripartite-type tricarboxylate transporter receptor subunit TctC